MEFQVGDIVIMKDDMNNKTNRTHRQMIGKFFKVKSRWNGGITVVFNGADVSAYDHRFELANDLCLLISQSEEI